MAEHKRRHGHPLQPKMFSSCDALPYHWNQASMAERVGLPPMQRLSHFKHPPTQVSCATYLPSSSPAAMGEWRSKRWRWSLVVVVTSLDEGGLWTCGHSSSDPWATETCGSIQGRLGCLFRIALPTPIWGRGLEKVPQNIACPSHPVSVLRLTNHPSWGRLTKKKTKEASCWSLECSHLTG